MDTQIGKCHLSESILSYHLYPPWEDAKAQPWEAKLLLRIEREYDYEISKVILPLFIVRPHACSASVYSTLVVCALSGLWNLNLCQIPCPLCHRSSQ